MSFTHTIRAQFRGLGRCALTGMLVGMLATPTFALSTPTLTNHEDDASTRGAMLETTAEAPDALPMIADDGADVNALPEAPMAESASLIAPAKADLLAAAVGSDSSTTSTSTVKKHHVRGGFIALGVVGGIAAGMGAYIFSIKTSNTGARDALGTMFLAPGAAAAGLGFYFAFK
jgi:hypothetical protein